MNKRAGFVSECFASVQGEGTWVGERQLFLRLAGCRETCAYCDTPQHRRHRPRRACARFPGRKEKPVWLVNPLTPVEAVNLVGRFDADFGPFGALAITGGEPLEQPDFVKACAREIKSRHWRLPILLETNGHRAEEFKKVRPYIDRVAADIKLASATGLPTPWARHVKFLKLARRLAGCVKVVVVPATTVLEIVHAARLAWECVPGWNLILQPATGEKWKTAARRRHLELLLQTAARLHPRVRLLPQLHPVLGMA
jgi:7-carboxy-7-deazaguanine synthase